MKKEFGEYLADMGMKESLTKRVEEILTFIEENFSEKILDIFVEDYIKEDGSREYESLIFFSDDQYFEAKNFTINDNFYIISFTNSITFIELTKVNYDFKETNDDSRFILNFNIGNVGGINLKASKNNCDNLKMILMKYIQPNLKK
jgi:hypothetical protein